MYNVSIKKVEKEQIKSGMVHIKLKYKEFIIILKENDILYYHNIKTSKRINKIDVTIEKERIRYNSLINADIPLNFNTIYTVIVSKRNKIYKTYVKPLFGEKGSIILMGPDLDSKVFSLKLEELFNIKYQEPSKGVYEVVTDYDELESLKKL